MKIFILILLSSICLSLPAYSQAILSGRVLDSETGEPLPGAGISIVDLARRTGADDKGVFILEGLPEGRFTVQVNLLGYKTLAQKVTISGHTETDFSLSPSLLEMREVVVTASASASDNKTNSVSVESISKQELLSAPSTNLIDAISRVPGVSQITSGPGISKPVIRGLSYNRVLTVNNGIKQEGQQWGDEHGLEFDMYAAEKVEILRGPASLLYGSDAMGGVINIIDPIPLPEGRIKGEFTSRYASNNGLTGNSLMLEGNQNGFVWRGRGTYQNAYSYRTPLGFASNTSFNETDFSGMLGLNKKWGYSHLNVSGYKGNLGFPEHEHEGEHEEEPGHEEEESMEGSSRQIALPMQEIRHFKASLNNNFIIGSNQLRANLGFQSNKRQEFEQATDNPDMELDLETWSADLKFFMEGKNGFEPVIGLSGTWQKNVAGGEELLIPDHISTGAGVFAYLRKELGNLSLNAGARFDYRNIRSDAMLNAEGEEQFTEFESDFSNFSGSIGLAYDLGSGFVLKANAGSAFRAPNISELASNGEHHGVERFEIGSSGLVSEQSLQFDASIGYASRFFGFELNGYSNTIYHYIYLRGSEGDSVEHEGEILPVYRYTQANANLSGLEAVIDIHPLEWIHIGSNFGLVRGINKETDEPLPFIPAVTWSNELKIEPRLNTALLKNTYLTVGLSSTFDQKHIDEAFERPAEGYHLVNAGLGTTLLLKQLPLTIFISASNLFDVEYVSHLSRYRYLDVLNPGRNIQFGVHIPFTLK